MSFGLSWEEVCFLGLAWGSVVNSSRSVRGRVCGIRESWKKSAAASSPVTVVALFVAVVVDVVAVVVVVVVMLAGRSVEVGEWHPVVRSEKAAVSCLWPE